VREEIEAIYRRHRQGLFTLALSITRCPELAEDAVHDACARLLRLEARPDRDAVAYVFAAVRNAALDHARRRRPSLEYPASIFDVRQTDPAVAAREAEQQRLAREAVDQLPLKQREAVVLRLYTDLTFEQIAETLGEPLPTVASRYRRALERIRRILEGSP
jgi:RNA polymerase sigma-70 factor (ECF subfamily)